ncbi:hypothetical protein LPB72_14855 [Hydrogenophaga crassostreae]|uniref:Flagellar protein FlgN n=1 Tax=Hydrogenophaga crassostreae TaxID=1763535 RepID=A0A167HH06_9BURK|nr:hypothetical protein [Hydrogenophaga crassostreae]AOW12239.1 hypothetical protein LPB072_04605 [Hydrogenophaga crassostreae]OAD41185.1 hypothetical protein LPB72_14855 [Hydrogenophaga crassostreae]
MAERTPVHPWIASLRLQLDGLEAALLSGDAVAVEARSGQIQAVLQQAPRTAEFGRPGSGLRTDMVQAAHRLGQLRQTVLRAGAQNQRALRSLLPDQAKQPTYGRLNGSSKSGPGQAFLSA